MILVDTSIWVDHLRRGDRQLSALLDDSLVVAHPFVIGELSCGNLRNRAELLSLLAALPQPKTAEHEEVLQLVARHRLHGRGLGWVDVHLLASTLLTGCALWTRDRSLADAARMLRIDA